MASATSAKQALIADYKSVLKACIDQRPSGMRQKIARVLGTHKSFVSQITNPTDSTPLPARHVEAIFEVCHLSKREQQAFLRAYGKAHPEQSEKLRRTSGSPQHYRTLHLEVPVLDDRDKERALEELIRDFARRISVLLV